MLELITFFVYLPRKKFFVNWRRSCFYFRNSGIKTKMQAEI